MTKKIKPKATDPKEVPELGSLGTAVDAWCEILAQGGHKNWAESFRNSFRVLQSAFAQGSAKQRYELLLNFQDRFSGGMGSINDISVGGKERLIVEAQRDALIDRYYDLVFPKK